MDKFRSVQSALAVPSLTLPCVAGVALLGLFSLLTYRRFFYPISDIPGPFLASLTRLWHMIHIVKGDQNLQLLELHDKHGTLENLLVSEGR
jgi:hypothetical protein